MYDDIIDDRVRMAARDAAREQDLRNKIRRLEKEVELFRDAKRKEVMARHDHATVRNTYEQYQIALKLVGVI